ncbi:MAG: phenylalanine--tRNA ligase subunit beta [Hyphomicrobiales bacterium]
MKFTLSWLKQYLETSATVDQLAAGLVGCGFEVESLTDRTKDLAAFTVARVIEARQHPDADRLRVCAVETAQGRIQVVCGAPNARTGLVGVFAPVGSHIPGTGIDLKKGVIRGVESNGMLCSERELLISQDHEGIIELDANIAVGTPAAQALGLDDPVFYIKVTPNRPDALGIYGIARDLAAKGLGKLKPLDLTPVKGSFRSPLGVSLAPDGNSCALFVGRFFRGVKNGPSPVWLQRQLKAIGLRPISALVDITNFMTFAFGRPLHVFDAAKVHGKTISARRAREGETIEALDGRTYALDPSITVIADEESAEAIAGIMGGEPSGCSDATTEVFLEAAYFDPIQTAAAGRKLGIQSDARYRFERGVDPAFVRHGAELATRMILEICGGEASEIVEAGAAPTTRRTVFLRPDRVERLGGLKVAVTTQMVILSDLGFGVVEGEDGRLECVVPTWRPDVHGEADLVEEVCRIVGLDEVKPEPLPRMAAVAKPVLSVRQRRMVTARRTLAERGLNEAVTWSFLPEAQARLFGGGEHHLKLANPISSELSDMRPSLLANLIAAAGRNVAQGYPDISLFEVGQVYAGDRPEDESLHASGVRRGNGAPRHWAGKARPVDAFDSKGDVMAVLEALGVSTAGLQVVQGGPAWYHPGRSGTCQLGPKLKLATFGELHPAVLERMDVKGPLVGFEINLDALPLPKGARQATRPPLQASPFMPLRRDFAFAVTRETAADKVVRAALSADKTLIQDVTVFDVFAGPGVEDGWKSLAIEVLIQPRTATLTDKEIEALGAKIVEQVAKATGGRLRQ